MKPQRAALAAVVVAAVMTPALAAADPVQLGGWVGPRFYSDDSALGYIDGAPAHPHLTNGMVLGVRVSRPLWSWLVPELEVPLAYTSTDQLDVGVLVLEPRLHLRFEFLPHQRYVQPFLFVGGGAPIALSNKKKIFATDAVGEGYFGIGAHAVTGRGFQIRADVRFAILPGVEKRAVLEVEAGIGLWVALGKGDKRYRARDPEAPAKPDPDPDRDGVALGEDKCPDRAEDEDGYDDRDGCPDIDNDLDHVLDIADKCISVPENPNGFEDDDGCPDSVPSDLEELEGTLEGVAYDPGQTSISAAGRRTLKKLAAVLAKYPSVRIQIAGYTDDREATPKPPADGEEPADPAQAAVALGVERAAVVKGVLVGEGVAEGRVAVVGKGAADPVGDNDNRRGRQANRRVVITRIMPEP